MREERGKDQDGKMRMMKMVWMKPSERTAAINLRAAALFRGRRNEALG
jgi:hypothetical protein